MEYELGYREILVVSQEFIINTFRRMGFSSKNLTFVR